MPYPAGIFEIQFDFQKHEVSISTSEGASVSRPLRAESVADFYEGIFEILVSLGIAVEIDLKPQEVPDAVPFDRDIAQLLLRCRVRASFLAHPRFQRESDRAVPREVHRQMQPGSFLLGQLRPGVHALFRTAGDRRAKAPSAVPLTRTKSAAPAFGPEAALSMARRITPTPFLSQPASRAGRAARRRRYGTRSSRNSF